ncbi:MAG: hypothetical protein HXS50_02970 [Theionarchaea archaeon]|nr:hypothetical protein [Theionarchaea archaeon]
MLRSPLASERIKRVDPETGISVIRLTSYPTPAAHLLYDWPSVTPDNGRILLFSQRTVRRNAPWDLFRVDSDGLNLYQLTEHGDEMERGGYYGRPAARLTLDGKMVILAWGHSLYSVEVEDGEVEEIISLEGVLQSESVVGNLFISSRESILYLNCSGDAGRQTFRVDLENDEIVELEIDGLLSACDPTGPRLVVSMGTVEWDTIVREDGSRVIINRGELRERWITDEFGEKIEYLSPEIFAHATLLGKNLKVQGCGLPPEKCIWIVERGEEPRRLAEGPYFWHSGASWDGEWIAADTNWPNVGIQLLHVPTGNFTTLCHAGATQDHYEFGHPHPCMSQDGSLCVFRSDRMGMPQIYVAHIPDRLKKMVKTGEKGAKLD